MAELCDPDWYLGEDVHRTFAELRRSDPVHWQEMPDEPGDWSSSARRPRGCVRA